jgi:hypothetical protein
VLLLNGSVRITQCAVASRNGVNVHFSGTVIKSSRSIIYVLAWSPESKFAANRNEFEQLAAAIQFQGRGIPLMPNGFKVIGFLGDDLDSWREAVGAEFPESYAIADRMNRMGMRMMREFHFDDPTFPA